MGLVIEFLTNNLHVGTSGGAGVPAGFVKAALMNYVQVLMYCGA
jgi:hypothetical protein